VTPKLASFKKNAMDALQVAEMQEEELYTEQIQNGT